MNYGYVICKEPISLYVWDGSMAKALINKGDKLDITYHEQDGSLGLTLDGVELCCSKAERAYFEEHWNVA